ncbi:DUF2254 family protein [Elioraea sp.]|uniref:DUF2254 family protein n=1 Tax=Elioraea sp. TaxID=2185103 RepID=UPI0038D1E5D7
MLASSTLTIATVTFSILMVVMTMTASTFSPRVLSGFMRDPVDQNTIGLFLGGFAFGAGGIVLLQPEQAYYDPRPLGLVLLITVIGASVVVSPLLHASSVCGASHPTKSSAKRGQISPNASSSIRSTKCRD